MFLLRAPTNNACTRRQCSHPCHRQWESPPESTCILSCRGARTDAVNYYCGGLNVIRSQLFDDGVEDTRKCIGVKTGLASSNRIVLVDVRKRFKTLWEERGAVRSTRMYRLNECLTEKLWPKRLSREIAYALSAIENIEKIKQFFRRYS